MIQECYRSDIKVLKECYKIVIGVLEECHSACDAIVVGSVPPPVVRPWSQPIALIALIGLNCPDCPYWFILPLLV